MTHIGEERGLCKVYWLGNLRERDHWGNVGVDGYDKIRKDLEGM